LGDHEGDFARGDFVSLRHGHRLSLFGRDDEVDVRLVHEGIQYRSLRRAVAEKHVFDLRRAQAFGDQFARLALKRLDQRRRNLLRLGVAFKRFHHRLGCRQTESRRHQTR
jgi:hypothetical protein